MADLPTLSEATQRLLKLHFEALVESFRLTDNAVLHYANAGEQKKVIAFSKSPSGPKYLGNWLSANAQAKRECGISSSTEVATRRFNHLAAEYFKLWSPSTGYDFFAVQLEVLKEQVLAEIKSIWKQTEVTAKWYESVCAPSVKTAVSERVKAFRDQARYSEMALLARSQLPVGKPDGPNSPVATPVKQTDKGPERPRGQHGPKRDYETAARVDAIVTRVAGSDPWKSKLDDICDGLDDEDIVRPKTWINRDPPIRNWTDAAATDPELAKKAIENHLKNAHR